MQDDGSDPEVRPDQGNGARPDQGRWRGYVQVALIAVVLAVALYFARAPGLSDESLGDAALMDNSAPPVAEVVLPTPTEEGLTIQLTGSVELDDTTVVKPEVEGRVVWVSPSFSDGNAIAAGETLFRIDPAEFEIEVEAAQAAVERAEARVEVEKVLASGWSRRDAYIALAQAELKEAQAALKLAKLRLQRTHIAFPYDIQVLDAGVSVGEFASPDITRSSQLGIVYQSSALQVEAPIESHNLAYLDPAVGRAVRMTGQMGSWDGEIVGVAPTVDPTSRLASVYLAFTGDESRDSRPPPGTFVEVEIAGPVFSDVFVLPNAVLQKGDSVWVVRDGKLQWFQPETYQITADGWMVKAFDPGEGVVVGALPGAREGLAVSAKAVQEAN